MHKAAVLFQRSHAQGCTVATYWYTNCLLSGMGLEERDEQTALRILRGAEPDARILERLGWCYREGMGVEKDLAQAARFYRQSALLGFPVAARRLRDFADGYDEYCDDKWSDEDAFINEALDAVEPFGEWDPRVHRWCSIEVRREIFTTVLLCKRLGIPRGVALHVASFVCTK